MAWSRSDLDPPSHNLWVPGLERRMLDHVEEKLFCGRKGHQKETDHF